MTRAGLIVAAAAFALVAAAPRDAAAITSGQPIALKTAAEDLSFVESVQYRGGFRRGGFYRGGVYRGGLYRGGLYRGGLYRGGVYRAGLYRGGLYRGGLYRAGLYRGGLHRAGFYRGALYPRYAGYYRPYYGYGPYVSDAWADRPAYYAASYYDCGWPQYGSCASPYFGWSMPYYRWGFRPFFGLRIRLF
jgi:hypothetical protein